jgi:glycosyltransferase involved in cell wall biosynthesis
LVYTTAEERRLAECQVADPSTGTIVHLGGDAPTDSRPELVAAFFAAFPQARGRQQILFLGRLHEKKGIDRVLAALPTIKRSNPEVLLTIAGSGEPGFVSGLQGAVADKGLQRNVLMTGALYGSLKWGAYASASLFVLASRQENFAITVAEAMHSGLPIVVSDTVNTWPLVKEARAGVVVAENVVDEQLASSVSRLLSSTEEAAEMGRRGQEYARRNLTWRRSAENMLQCYEAVLAETGVRQA